MYLKSLELTGFKSFAKKHTLDFSARITAIVGPNGSGKSNTVEAIRFVLGEQSMKSLRGKGGSDLIFKGSKNISKQNRASVSITFDNSKKIFSLPEKEGQKNKIELFDEVTISREVFSDGASRYLINGTEVRLKDILEMLSVVNIGSSGHHIISQGEADRLLSASGKDRKIMIEDALGLKIFQYRIKETERKLEKTKSNIKEVEILKREIGPHLNFLKKQVEKIEKTEEFKKELKDLYQEYLKKEEAYLDDQKSLLENEDVRIGQKLEEINKFLSVETEQKENPKEKEILDYILKTEKEIGQIRQIKDELSRKLGRIEGIIEIEEKRLNNLTNSQNKLITIPSSEIKDFKEKIISSIDSVLNSNDTQSFSETLKRVKFLVSEFLKSSDNPNQVIGNGGFDLVQTKKDRLSIIAESSKIGDEENKLIEILNENRKKLEDEKQKNRQDDQKKFELKIEKNNLLSEQNILNLKKDNFLKLKNDFDEEIKEGSVLLGMDVFEYRNFIVQEKEIDRSLQEERRRKIERIKIKLEDAGVGGSGDILKEFEETKNRDLFLANELADLNKSIKTLDDLVSELRTNLDVKFNEGIIKINEQFDEFFKLMFGGGDAKLTIIENKINEDDDLSIEDESKESLSGIEINISLPQKKVKDLQALSGGERSLTSIALLFAMSQVNPPPFLVLDETDAALDEANSRKYGDMLEKLSKYSQLILVTHNRETMSRASALYGVTIGSDGASKLLSVRFEDAVAIAK